jgi:hypothetical protein
MFALLKEIFLYLFNADSRVFKSDSNSRNDDLRLPPLVETSGGRSFNIILAHICFFSSNITDRRE